MIKYDPSARYDIRYNYKIEGNLTPANWHDDKLNFFTRQILNIRGFNYKKFKMFMI